MNDSSPLSVRALTSREVEILTSLSKGLSHKQIAEQDESPAGTVRTHIERIRVKLGAHNIPHAVALGYKAGILKASEDA